MVYSMPNRTVSGLHISNLLEILRIFGNRKEGYAFFKLFQKRMIRIQIIFQIIIFHKKKQIDILFI